MYFFKSLFGAAALAVAAAAQLTFDAAPTNVEIGQTYTITYTAPDMGAPVTITLKQGDPSALQDVMVLTSTSTGGTFLWSPSPKIVSNTDYALEIAQGSQTNFFGPIVINTFLEPSPGTPTPPASTPPPPATTLPPVVVPSTISTLIPSPPPPTPVTSTLLSLPPPPPPTSSIVLPPINTSVPTPSPPPFVGGAAVLTASLPGVAAIFASFVYFL